jgi:hypothetical protein
MSFSLTGKNKEWGEGEKGRRGEREKGRKGERETKRLRDELTPCQPEPVEGRGKKGNKTVKIGNR